MRLLVDTNILLDLYKSRAPYAADFKHLLLAKFFGDVELWASSKSFFDACYVCERDIRKNAHQFGETERSALTAAILKSTQFFNICSIERSDVEMAFASGWEDVEDALIYSAAQKIKADYIVTRNPKDFTKSRIPILDAREFMEVMERDHNLVYEEVAF